MAEYCIVCSRDLSTDPNANPPYCSAHSHGVSVAEQQFSSEELERRAVIGALVVKPCRRIYLANIKSPTTGQGKVTANWVVDEYDTDDFNSKESPRRIRVEPVSFEGRVSGRDIVITRRGNLGDKLHNIYLEYRKDGWRGYFAQPGVSFIGNDIYYLFTSPLPLTLSSLSYGYDMKQWPEKPSTYLWWVTTGAYPANDIADPSPMTIFKNKFYAVMTVLFVLFGLVYSLIYGIDILVSFVGGNAVSGSSVYWFVAGMVVLILSSVAIYTDRQG